MRPTYITAIGIHAERVPSVGALADALARGEPPAASGDRFSKMAARLDPRVLPLIDREDRSILTEITISILNAIADAVAPGSPLWSDDHEDMLVYAATDALEYDFTPLASHVARHPTGDGALRRLGDLKGLVNPLSMLRHLSTNTIYHVSKRLQARGGGYPTRSMSLSGISVVEDAVLELGGAPAPGRAIAVASGNMRGFDSLTGAAPCSSRAPTLRRGGRWRRCSPPRPRSRPTPS